MPKPNSTESNLQQQEAVLLNTSNSNLNSRMVDVQSTTKDMNKSKRKVNVDDECDAIGDLIGHYGKWQFMMTILLSLFQVPNTFHIFSPTFQVNNLNFIIKKLFINFVNLGGRQRFLVPTTSAIAKRQQLN
jgi:hypothetical protein